MEAAATGPAGAVGHRTALGPSCKYGGALGTEGERESDMTQWTFKK